MWFKWLTKSLEEQLKISHTRTHIENNTLHANQFPPHTNTSQCDCLCRTHYDALCVLESKQYRKGTQATPSRCSQRYAWGLIRGVWDLWPQVWGLILGRESIWGLAWSWMIPRPCLSSTWSRLCGGRVKGLWLTKPLIPQQPCSLWSASLWGREGGREDQSCLDTCSQWALLHTPSLPVCQSLTLCLNSEPHPSVFPPVFCPPPHNN